MVSASRIVEAMEKRRFAELDRLADQIMRENDYRLHAPTHVPVKRRGRRVHRIQKLSLIDLAAKRKFLKRQIRGLIETHGSEDLQACVQDFEAIVFLLENSVDKCGTNRWGESA